MPEPPQGLHDFCVSPVRFLANAKDCIADTFLNPGATGFAFFGFGSVGWGVFDAAYPFAKRGVADDRDEFLDFGPEFLPMFDQRAPLLIAERNPIR